jgi:hypothetical protein
MYGPITKPLNFPSDLLQESKFQHYPIFVACGHVWARYNLKMCLKNKLRGVPRELLSSPKVFVFLREMKFSLNLFLIPKIALGRERRTYSMIDIQFLVPMQVLYVI